MLGTLRFVFFTILALVLIFSAVLVTVLNTYKPTVKAYIGDKFVGYFSSEQQFDEVYNDLVTEKQNVDSDVKVYLDSEPTFETSYTRDSLIAKQNVYTNLRAEMKTEYTVYEVAVDGDNKMKFDTKDDANKYAENLKAEVSKLNVEVNIKDKIIEKAEKQENAEEMNLTQIGDNINKDIKKYFTDNQKRLKPDEGKNILNIIVANEQIIINASAS